MRLISRLVGVCACLGVLLAAPAVAQAKCTGSTPAAAVFADDPLDAQGIAPELTDVKVSLDANCAFSVDPGLEALGPDDALITYIDTDGPARLDDSGAISIEVVALTFSDGEQAMTFLGFSDGEDIVLDDSTAVGTTTPSGSFSIPVDRLAIVPGATVGVRVVALRFGEEDFGTDFAPEAEAPEGIKLRTVYHGTPVAPPAPPAAPDDPGSEPGPRPSLPTLPAPGSTTPTTTARCTVPKVRGRSRSAANARLVRRGCAPARRVIRRYSATVRKGRVIGTSPGTGARTAKRVTLVVSKGRRPGR